MKERENERERDTIREEAKCRERRRNKETIEEEEREREMRRIGGGKEGRNETSEAAAKYSCRRGGENVRTYIRTWLGGREVRDGNVTGLSIRAASTTGPPTLRV